MMGKSKLTVDQLQLIAKHKKTKKCKNMSRSKLLSH